MIVTDPVTQATALLMAPGFHEWGQPDIAARIAEYGAQWESWPCDEWDWQRDVWVMHIDGSMHKVDTSEYIGVTSR